MLGSDAGEYVCGVAGGRETGEVGRLGGQREGGTWWRVVEVHLERLRANHLAAAVQGAVVGDAAVIGISSVGD